MFEFIDAAPARLNECTCGGFCSRSEVECERCDAYLLCRAAGLGSDPVRFATTVACRRPFPRDRYLVHAGDPCRALYAVKSGALSSIAPLDDGHEQIVAFHMPGDIIGLEAVLRHHNYAVRALEPCTLCRLPLTRSGLGGASRHILHERLVEVYGAQVRRLKWNVALTGAPSAEQRFAGFLVNLSLRLEQRAMPHRRFRLPMTREEIANHLGLAAETISRTIRRLRERGIIEISGRNVELRDLPTLRAIARLPARFDGAA